MASRKTVNIPKDTIDPHFRYKRVVVQGTFVRKNGGCWFVDSNTLALLSKGIARPQKSIVQHIKKRINAPVYETKEGVYFKTLNSIDDMVEDYILENVLCKTCGNPETFIEGNKATCKACGDTN
jgi:hypothetical protein